MPIAQLIWVESEDPMNQLAGKPLCENELVGTRPCVCQFPRQPFIKASVSIENELRLSRPDRQSKPDELSLDDGCGESFEVFADTMVLPAVRPSVDA